MVLLVLHDVRATPPVSRLCIHVDFACQSGLLCCVYQHYLIDFQLRRSFLCMIKRTTKVLRRKDSVRKGCSFSYFSSHTGLSWQHHIVFSKGRHVYLFAHLQKGCVQGSSARNRLRFSVRAEDDSGLNWQFNTSMAMSEVGRISNKTSQQQTQPKSDDYIWSYEYYDYEPVSFEGLKAHRYSIVIGFWVGLAVFVIFMFFVLTLLTKTGAPHQESTEPSEKRCRMNSFVADFGRPLAEDQVFSHQANEESRSLFHCYINEVDQMERTKHATKATNQEVSDLHLQEPHRHGKLDDMACLMKFNIPNFVVSDQCSSVSDDDLLIYEPPIILEKQAVKDV